MGNPLRQNEGVYIRENLQTFGMLLRGILIFVSKGQTVQITFIILLTD